MRLRAATRRQVRERCFRERYSWLATRKQECSDIAEDSGQSVDHSAPAAQTLTTRLAVMVGIQAEPRKRYAVHQVLVPYGVRRMQVIGL